MLTLAYILYGCINLGLLVLVAQLIRPGNRATLLI